MPFSVNDLFRDEFALYLALGLLGPSRVIGYLNDDKRKEPTVPLYWRSKLMIPDPSRMLYNVGENTDLMSSNFPFTKILFFDVTFNFVKKTHHRGGKDNKCDLLSKRKAPSCHILVSLGFFLLLQKGFKAVSEDLTDVEIGGGHYISTEALDYQQIVSHINSLQLDPQSVTAEALASSMAEEFLRQGFLSSIITPREIGQQIKIQQRIQEKNGVLTANYVNNSNSRTGFKEGNEDMKNKSFPNQSHSFDESSTNCEILAIIPYKSMGDSSGKLLLKYSPSGVTKFDRSALRFLSWDFSKNPNHYENLSRNNESVSSQKILVEHAIDQWRIQAENSGSSYDNDNNPDKQRLESSSDPVVSSTAVESYGTRTNEKRKKRSAVKGMVILPSARRKRNKGLVYDTK